MTERQGKAEGIDGKALLAEAEAIRRAVVKTALQEVLEAEWRKRSAAGKGERTPNRLGYCSGYTRLRTYYIACASGNALIQWRHLGVGADAGCVAAQRGADAPD